MKILFEDYVGKWNLNKIYELYKTDGRTSGFLTLVIMSFTLFLNASTNDYAYILGMCIPMVIVYLSSVLHPVKLDKMYYICPLTIGERKNYIVKSYIFQIIVHMIIFIPGIILIICVSSFRPLAYVVIILNDFFMSTLVYAGKSNSDKDIICKMILIEAIITSNIAELVVLSDKGSSHMIAQLILLCVLVLIIIPLYIVFLRFIRKEIEEAVTYKG